MAFLDDYDFDNIIPSDIIHMVKDLGYMENLFMEQMI